MADLPMTIERRTDWRPMSEAPRDGTRVLLWARAENVNYAHSCVIGFHARDVWWTGHGCAFDPRCWMPLPEAPREVTR